jgi:hypothetical protein
MEFMKRLIIITLLLLFFTQQMFSQKKENRNHSTSSNIGRNKLTTDDYVYVYLFHAIVSFDKESENTENIDDKVFLATFYQKEAELTDEEFLNLKAISYNFVAAFPLTRKKARKNLTKDYKNLLSKSIGLDKFSKFDNYLKIRLAPTIKVLNFGKFVNIGSSSITYNPTTNLLKGISGIIFSDGFLPPVPPVPCSTSATMTGQGVSESGSDSADCNIRGASVTLTSTSALPGSNYCTTANHIFGTQTQTTTACLDTPSVQNVTSVTFEQIETDDLPISSNPNEGDGFRIFADDKTPNDPKNRRKIRVKAKYGQALAGVAVYFESYDLDDPSIADAANTAGDDNKDEVDPVGRFSIPNGATGCEIFEAELIKCTTNSSGDVAVEFTVSRQPGDNFSIAASTNALLLGEITVSGLDLLKANNQPVPIVCPNSNVCRSEVLTVWRRLHLEVDSMGVVSGNKEMGTFAETKKISNTETQIYVNTSNPLDLLRFNGGRLVSGTKKFNIVSNGTNYVRIKPQFGRAATLYAGENFVVYDDDDYNNLNISALIGDNGENITNPSHMLEGLSATSDLPDDNILAPAYIKPVYDAVDTRDDNNFHANLPPLNPNNINSQRDNVRSFFDKWDSSATNADRKYWSAYVLGAYQPEKNEDADGGLGSATYGIVDQVTNNNETDDIEGSGTLIFLEMNRSKEQSGFSLNKINRKSLQVLIAHEIGHLLGCNHGELGIMGDTSASQLGSYPLSNKFTTTSLNIIRNIKHP